MSSPPTAIPAASIGIWVSWGAGRAGVGICWEISWWAMFLDMSSSSKILKLCEISLRFVLWKTSISADTSKSDHCFRQLCL